MNDKVTLVYDKRKKQKPWLLRWFGLPDENGQRKRYSKAFRLKREAEAHQAAQQANFDRGATRDKPQSITLRELANRYEQSRRTKWRESTRRHVQEICARLLTYFGDVPLHAITPERAAAFLSVQKVIKRGARRGQPVSRYTYNRFLRYSKTLFKYAVEKGHLAGNPFAGETLIRVGKRAAKRWHYLQPQEYLALLRVVPLRWKVTYAMAYCSGARFGELFNLTAENLDFEKGRLLIKNRPASEALPPFQIKDHEEREIPLPRHVLRLLQGWLRVREPGSPLILLAPDRFAFVQRRWHEHRRKGKPWLNSFLLNNWLRGMQVHVRKAGIQLRGAFTMHALRKSCGQNWANHLPMNVVKELLGHSALSTTVEFYSTVSAEHEAQAVAVTDALVKPARPATDGRNMGHRTGENENSTGLAADPQPTSNRKKNDAKMTPSSVIGPKHRVV